MVLPLFGSQCGSFWEVAGCGVEAQLPLPSGMLQPGTEPPGLLLNRKVGVWDVPTTASCCEDLVGNSMQSLARNKRSTHASHCYFYLCPPGRGDCPISEPSSMLFPPPGMTLTYICLFTHSLTHSCSKH